MKSKFYLFAIFALTLLFGSEKVSAQEHISIPYFSISGNQTFHVNANGGTIKVWMEYNGLDVQHYGDLYIELMNDGFINHGHDEYIRAVGIGENGNGVIFEIMPCPNGPRTFYLYSSGTSDMVTIIQE